MKRQLFDMAERLIKRHDYIKRKQSQLIDQKDCTDRVRHTTCLTIKNHRHGDINVDLTSEEATYIVNMLLKRYYEELKTINKEFDKL